MLIIYLIYFLRFFGVIVILEVLNLFLGEKFESCFKNINEWLLG